jgi:4-hydroxy-tetrahydrodipicolinate reductase
MGRLLAEEVPAAGAVVSGGIRRADSGSGAPSGIALLPSLAALAEASDVVIDFTHASTAQASAAIMAKSGKAWVLGSSGLSAADEAAVETAARSISIVYASNFSAGVNLVLALCERMGATLPAESYDAEIMEGRGRKLEDVMVSGRHGHSGARETGAIGFAALRGGQVVGEHTLIFASATEHIALTHRAFDRRVYATGAVRAALWAVGRKPGLYSMMDVLGMT